MLTRLHERAWPRDAHEEREGAPYVVTIGEAAAEASRHGSAEAALEAARAQGPGTAVWRERDLAELGGAGPLAEVIEG